jgi:hypothetical protein
MKQKNRERKDFHFDEVQRIENHVNRDLIPENVPCTTLVAA